MKKAAKLILLLTSVLVFCAFTPQVFAADLNSLIEQRNKLQAELEKSQSAASNKNAEAKSLQTQINSLNNDIKDIESKISQTGSQIDNTQKSIDDLSGTIDQKNQELAKLKTQLNTAIVELYRFSSRSDLEVFFGSTSLADSSNQSKYVEAVQMQVNAIYSKVKGVKADLEKQKGDQEAKKAELDSLKNQQEAYRKGVEYQKIQKNKILGMTVDQQKQYEANASKLKSEITSISSQIYAERQKRLSGGREQLVGGGSGYPYSSIDEPDAWGFLTRECTSYAAWYLNVVQGKDFVNTRPGSGSAYNWPNLARDQGLNVSSTPRVGAIISWEAGSLTSAWGHVAAVEAVNSDGTIDVSEYNWIRYSYSYRRNVDPNDYGGHSYIY